MVTVLSCPNYEQSDLSRLQVQGFPACLALPRKLCVTQPPLELVQGPITGNNRFI